ncbi:MAG: putative selenate reductase subunit YgfK [Fusobacteria bacterium]|nr:putative selenate reductase subunit YgfK [Fusobacteriota bacterium]
MSDLMRMIPFSNMMEWMLKEYKDQKSIFGIRDSKFYRNNSGKYIEVNGEKITSPLGPAAGPNSQLTQNIVASYLAGCRFIELKTIQEMDGADLRACVAKPCINAQDEGYNVEWSTELTVQEAYDEYIKAWFILHVIGKELGLNDGKDFAFNMSVGYDLDNIKKPKVSGFIDNMIDASNTAIWKECKEYLLDNLDQFSNVDKDFVESISANVCPSATISTLHGCPPAEIERIAMYLLEEKKLNTFIKLNPTLNGYEFARKLMDEMGYDYIGFDDHHFNNDLQWDDAVVMLTRLKEVSKNLGLGFGVKLTNTFAVQIANKEFPQGEEMYMSGRSLFPLTISLANKLSQYFNGDIQISYSGGADFFNINEIIDCGIQPITVATTILKPGGYERVKQLADEVEAKLDGKFKGLKVDALNKLATEVITNKYHVKARRTAQSRKTDSKLPLFDCFKAPCKDGGCPINQQIPEYLKLVSDGNYAEAYKVIVNDNTSPGVLGTICDHQCQYKCTRLDYDQSLEIRNAKKLAVENAADAYIANIKAVDLKTDKKVAVIGAGPAGCAVATFLRRNGVGVTVFERKDRPYGVVEHVIPEFRISKEMIARDVALAEKAGVEFKFNVDENFDIAALKGDFDKVVIAIGTWDKGISPVKEGADELRDALEFLEDYKSNKGNITLGKKVAVIGGGDVAMDCARAAKRVPGVEEVTIVYRRTIANMPAEPEEIELAIEDGVLFKELLAPATYFNRNLTCEIMELGEREEGGRCSIVGTCNMVNVEADVVIGATGARLQKEFLSGLEVDARGYAKIGAYNETSIPGVYVAGDCKAGPSTIVKAVADGKKVAKDILAQYGLENDFVKFEVKQDETEVYRRKGILQEASKSPLDGKRCLVCDQICELCVDVCPNRANVKVIVNGTHQILHIDGMCNECGNCGIFCPHDGNPYKDKVTYFWTEEDFVDSTNKGFLPIGNDTFKVRVEDGSVIEHKLGDGQLSAQMAAMLDAVLKDYSYYNMMLEI